jgi:hypothetical protein
MSGEPGKILNIEKRSDECIGFVYWYYQINASKCYGL